MKLVQDTERVTVGLKEAITVLCKTGLNFDSELHIDGLLGITLDNEEVLLVKIKEIIRTPNDDDTTSNCGDGEVIDLCLKDSTSQVTAEEQNNRSPSSDERWEENIRSLEECPMVIQPDYVAQSDLRDSHVKALKLDCASSTSPLNQVNSEVHSNDTDVHKESSQTNSIASDNSQGPSIAGFADQMSDEDSSGVPVNLCSYSSVKDSQGNTTGQVKLEKAESQTVQQNSVETVKNSSSIPNFVPFNEQELHAKWLQNIAAHVQGPPSEVNITAHNVSFFLIDI